MTGCSGKNYLDNLISLSEAVTLAARHPDWSAIPISPYLEEILEERPEYFSVISELFPQGMILMLESYQVAGLLTRTTVFVKYGILPDGYYFKVVSSPHGLKIGKEKIFLLKSSAESLKCIDSTF